MTDKGLAKKQDVYAVLIDWDQGATLGSVYKRLEDIFLDKLEDDDSIPEVSI